MPTEQATTNLTALLLGSAAVGALVSSVVTLVGQAIERRSRRKELVLSEAVKMAEKHVATVVTVAMANGRRTEIVPLMQMVNEYHQHLTYLLEHGEPDPTFKVL